MENKNSEIILNRVLESMLLEQTGLVYIDPNKSKKKQDGPGALGYLAEYSTILVWAAGLLSAGLLGKFLKGRLRAIKAAGGISNIGWKNLLSFQRNISTPKGIAKIKRQCQRDVSAGRMTTAERNEIFELLNDPQVLQSIRERVFDDVLKKFKRGQMPAAEFIAHLDLKTAREVGPVLRQMEKDGVAGARVGKTVKTELIPKGTIRLARELPETIDKYITKLDKMGNLKKIFSKEQYEKWKTNPNKMGTGYWLSNAISKLKNQFAKGEAYAFNVNVNSIDEYVKLLKQNNLSVPTDIGSLNQKWQEYQLKALINKTFL